MTKFSLRSANLADAHDVLQNVSDITEIELIKTFGANTPNMLRLRTLRDFLAAGPADVLLEDGKPIAVFGHMPHSSDDGARVTWFLASQRYFDLGTRGVVYTRRYLAKLHQQNDGLRFYTYTLSSHPGVPRWFRALGYSSIGNYSLAGGGSAYLLSPTTRRAARDAVAEA